MRYLQTEAEILTAEKYMQIAAKEAKKSPCQKSKRGVVIVKDGEIIGRGFNAPPDGFECESDICKSICSKYAIHAEMNAMHNALENGYNIEGSRLYHINAQDGQMQTSGKPSCVDCSKHILRWKIKEVVLKQLGGYGLYNAKEFHEESLEEIIK